MGLGILLLIVIGGFLYLGYNSGQKNAEPIIIYGTTEFEENGDSRSTKDSRSENMGQDEVETQRIPISKESMSSRTQEKSSKNTNLSVPSGESAQQESDAVEVNQIDAAKKLAEERPEQEKREALAEMKARWESPEVAQKRADSIIAKIDALLAAGEQEKYTFAEHLNSLSVEEQLSYFFDNEERVNENLAKVIDLTRANGASQETIRLLKQFAGEIAEKATSIEGINERIEQLREYGFEPKF
jgi:hypothetical protein